MGKALNIDYVKNFVKENSECQLISNDYINSTTKMKFKCKCGNIFETSFNKFNSQNQRQCQECGKELLFLQRRLSIEEVREEINNRGAYLISTEYKTNSIPLKIKCKCGKIFKRCYSNIQQTEGEIICRSCSSTKTNLLSYDYIKEYVENNTECELISKEYIDCRKSLVFKCSCGKTFKSNWNNFYSSNQRRCLSCSKYHSKAEIEIENILKENGIGYIMEYRFKECRYKRMLPFDFYLPKYNLLIEYDGEFHYKNIPIANLELQKKRDNIKNEFCKENNINLLRIKYSEFDNIKNIIINYIANTEIIN